MSGLWGDLATPMSVKYLFSSAELAVLGVLHPLSDWWLLCQLPVQVPCLEIRTSSHFSPSSGKTTSNLPCFNLLHVPSAN